MLKYIKNNNSRENVVLSKLLIQNSSDSSIQSSALQELSCGKRTCTMYLCTMYLLSSVTWKHSGCAVQVGTQHSYPLHFSYACDTQKYSLFLFEYFECWMHSRCSGSNGWLVWPDVYTCIIARCFLRGGGYPTGLTGSFRHTLHSRT